MLVDGTVTMLIKVDEKHPAPDGAATHTIDGATYYESDSDEAALTATNYRRSSLNLTKVIGNEGAPEDAEFQFTLNVVNALAPEAEPAEDPEHNSDSWVWVSVRDKDGNKINDAVVSGATPSGNNDGWYYGVSGQDIVLNAQAGYSIRINNLPSGTTYTITEGNVPDGFKFDKSELEIAEGDGTDSTFTAGQTTTGTIESTNTLYLVKFTNTYTGAGSIVLAAAKTVQGADLAEGQFSFKLTGNGIDQTKTNDAEGSVLFDAIAYTQADAGKTFTYEITEVNDGQEGIVYDDHTCTVTVTVADNGDGTLKVTAEYTDGQVASFLNKFTNAAVANFAAKKTLEGRDLVAGEFSFELADADGKVVATATNAADGTIDFGSIEIEEAGTYTYTATEVAGSDETITYDSSKKTYTVEVTEQDGKLTAKVTCDEGDVPTFTNKYTPKEEPPTPPEIPVTGDSLPVVALLAVAAAAAVTGVVAIRRRSTVAGKHVRRK